MVTFGPIIGPFIGGYLQHFFNWQADFYFFGTYSFILLVIMIKILPETNSYLKRQQSQNIFIMIKTIMGHQLFILTAIACSLTYSLLIIFNTMGPFLLQKSLQYTVTAYGHFALLLGTAYFIGNLANRWLINFYQPMKIAKFALIGALCISSIMIILALFCHMNIFIILIPTWIIFILCGLTFPNMIIINANIFPQFAGTAGALIGFILSVCVFVITAITSFLSTKNQMPLAITDWLILTIGLTMLFVIIYQSKQPVKQ